MSPISVAEVPDNRKFARSLDPNGELDYTVDWSNVLGNNTIDTVSTTLSSAAQTAGLEIVTSASIDGSTTTIRLGVSNGNESNSSFDPPDGSDLAFSHTMTDSAGQVWEFTFVVNVVQQ
jgi:hypothetical protein